MTDPGLSPVIALLEAGIEADWHDCAQRYVSLRGEPLLEVAVGESTPGRAPADRRRDAVVLGREAPRAPLRKPVESFATTFPT